MERGKSYTIRRSLLIESVNASEFIESERGESARFSVSVSKGGVFCPIGLNSVIEVSLAGIWLPASGPSRRWSSFSPFN